MTTDWQLAVAVLRLSTELLDGITAGVARRGFIDVRPAHGFAFVRISAGTATTSEVADHLGVTKQAASQLVDQLIRAGYVRRDRDTRDARAWQLSLTERGEACTRAAAAAAAETVRGWRDKLSPDEWDRLQPMVLALTTPRPAPAVLVRHYWSVTTATELTIPRDLLPIDGRFGSGPSKVPAGTLAAFAEHGGAVMGTSHRRDPVKSLIGRIRAGLRTMFDLPDGYQVVLGNGGSTAFWDAAAFGLIRQRCQHVTVGEFSAKFAAVTRGAPFLAEPAVLGAPVGAGTLPQFDAQVDAYAWPQNETSTGVMLGVERVAGAGDALHLVDATSAAVGIDVDVSQSDVYYFAPQKGFAGDGGLWLAFFSPSALDRAAELGASGRWIPPSLDLTIAIENSSKDQTYNTPAIATLWLLAYEIEQQLALGGLAYTTGRCTESASRLYAWAQACDLATPFVTEPALRSTVVATIDFDAAVDAGALAAALRANGIVDTEPYRGLGRNQLRIGMYPAVDPDDITALTGCIDYLLPRLAG